jgi:Rab GDP dissociation inhibitor
VHLRDKAYISKGYDATTHFETTVEDVLSLYRRITGADLDLSKEPTTNVDQQQD